MRRLHLIRVSTPSVLLGAALLLACLVGAWYVSRVQVRVRDVLTRNAASVEAAHQLEVHINRLRARLLMYLANPTPELAGQIDADRAGFEHWFARAERNAYTGGEQDAVARIRTAYDQFWAEAEPAREGARPGGSPTDVRALAAQASVRSVVEPSEEYGRLNEEQMARAVADNERLGRWLQVALLALGVIGPLGGLLSGYGFARGLRESVFGLSVQVRNITQSLEGGAGEVVLTADGDLAHLDEQLRAVTGRVAEVVDRMRRQEREILRAEQLAAVGQLAAGVAHEIRNPLTAIKMLVAAAARPDNPRPLTPEALRVIHGEVMRLERTVEEFLGFARPPALRKEPCDVERVIIQAVALVTTRAKHQRVGVEFDPRTVPLVVFADGGRLTSVVVNLLLNALDAMPGGGTLSVTLSGSPSTGTVLVVTDTGPGIPAHVLPRLFTPFVSSKPTGTGLGLSICKRVVEDHGGTISADNPPGGGAKFTVILPPTPGEADRADAAGG